MRGAIMVMLLLTAMPAAAQDTGTPGGGGGVGTDPVPGGGGGTGATPTGRASRTVSGQFAFGFGPTYDQATILPPPLAGRRDYDFAGSRIALDNRMVRLPGFDPMLGTLVGATVTVRSDQGLMAGAVSFDAVGKEYSADFKVTAAAMSSIMVGGQRMILDGLQASAHCVAVQVQSCLGTDSALFSTERTIALAPGALPAGDLLFDLETWQNTAWWATLAFADGGQPRLQAANILSWRGTASVTYDYIVAAQPAAVPEPASWATMIAGFGLVGLAGRRGLRATRPA